MFSSDSTDDDRGAAAGTAPFAHFETDLTAEDWGAKRRAGELGFGPIFWAPIQVLSPTVTVGLGRTNLTLIRPTIVQTDAAEPYAGFDLRESPHRNPAVSVHFNPAAYGATGPGTYVFTFAVDAPTRAAFTPSGYAGSGTVDAPGSIRFSGRRRDGRSTAPETPSTNGWDGDRGTRHRRLVSSRWCTPSDTAGTAVPTSEPTLRPRLTASQGAAKECRRRVEFLRTRAKAVANRDIRVHSLAPDGERAELSRSGADRRRAAGARSSC